MLAIYVWLSIGEKEILEARVICKDCEFVDEFEPGDDEHPLDLMNQHQQKTDHKLREERLD